MCSYKVGDKVRCVKDDPFFGDFVKGDRATIVRVKERHLRLAPARNDVLIYVRWDTDLQDKYGIERLDAKGRCDLVYTDEIEVFARPVARPRR